MRMRFSTLALLGLLSIATGCGTTIVPPPPEPVADTTITSGVKAAIVQSEELDATDIDVVTSEGIVQLSGFVSSPDSVATAAMVARTVKGVKSVKNDLRLK